MIRVYRDKRETAPLSGGEANTGANVGTSGIGPYDGKTGTTLNFRKAYGTEGHKTALNGQQVDHSLDIYTLSTVETPVTTSDFLAWADSDAPNATKRALIQTIWNTAFAYYCSTTGDMMYKGPIFPAALSIPAADRILTSTATAPQWSTGSTINGLLDPTRTLILTAAGGHGTTTSGAGDANGLPEQAETTTNKINYWYLAYALNEKAFWVVEMPGAYDGLTFDGYFVWTSDNGSVGHECKFEIKGRAFANDDALDQACGTARSPGDDALLAQGDLHKTALLSAATELTLAGSPAGNQYAYFEVKRVAVDDGTEISGDVKLLQVVLEYDTTSNSD